jgi:predicted  nucleic acid-binding Zn-ribbon protein
MQMQYEENKLFTKTMEEQSALLMTISHQLENLNKAIPELQAKVSKAETDISSLSNVQSSLVNKEYDLINYKIYGCILPTSTSSSLTYAHP